MKEKDKLKQIVKYLEEELSTAVSNCFDYDLNKDLDSIGYYVDQLKEYINENE